MQVAHILADSGAALLISGKARLGDARAPATSRMPRALDEEESAALLRPSATRCRRPPQDPDDLAALLYTSGSTGRPKGVMLSHANLWLGAISVAHYLRLTPADRTLAVLPFSFDYGQNQLLSTWAAGGVRRAARLSRRARRDPRGRASMKSAPWPAFRRSGCSWSRRPGRRAAALSLRRLTNSGGRLPASVVRRMRELFPAADIYSMYGLTEAFRSTYLEPALLDDHPDSIGKRHPLRRRSWSSTPTASCAPGEEGELVHAGPLVAKGYWKDPERTARAVQAGAGGLASMAAWRSGRATGCARDAAGLLYFVGREDGMIKTSGNRVSPTEVEEAAIACGRRARGGRARLSRSTRLGEGIALVVRPDRRGREEELRAFLKRELPNFMQPGAIVWREELPRSPNGKLDRVALKSRTDVMTKPMGPIPAGYAGDQDCMLLIGGRRADALVAEAGDTPLFVYDLGLVRRQDRCASAPPFRAFIFIMP